MAHQNGSNQFKRVQYMKNIIRQTLVCIAGIGMTGSTESTPGDSVNMGQGVSFPADSSNTCAVFPEPVSSTRGLPDPPQSSTSSRTPSSTVTNWTRCLDGSRHVDSWAHSADVTSQANSNAF